MAFQYNHYYEIYNGGKYVNLNGDHENNVVNNGEKVTMYARTNNPDQRWALERYGSDNQVRIVLQRGGGWYALNYNTENTNCIVWHLNSAADKDTVITLEPAVSFGGVYRLKLAQRNLYLTVVGSSLKWWLLLTRRTRFSLLWNPVPIPAVQLATVSRCDALFLIPELVRSLLMVGTAG